MPARDDPTALGPSGFFALRTPLLPFDEFAAWGEGLEAPAARLSMGGSVRVRLLPLC